MNVVKNIFKGIGILFFVAALVVVAGLAALTITEYRPADTESLTMHGAAQSQLAAGDTFTMVTWNTGYGGLSEEADFFMDGGSGVRTVSEAGVNANVAGMIDELSALEPDVVFLQEVDVDSARSYNINQEDAFAQAFGAQGFSNALATNYRVMFVPYPIPPLGKIDCGIMTLNSFAATSAERVQLPCPFSWPIRTANLKRCLLVERVPVEGSDAELVLINLHLEAYDDGEGKAKQTAQLAKLMQQEYKRGNYVIAAGDFNQSFSTVDTSAYPLQGEGLWECGYLDAESFGEDFTLVMDPSVPTCRSLDRPLDLNDPSFQYYMIDGFIVSANVQIDRLETLDTGFDYSDHNPVIAQFTLL